MARGGTGATSLIDGGVLLGSGTGAVTATAVLGDGEILIGDGTTDPVALDIGSSTAVTIVGALNSGSITSGFGTIDTGSSAITTTGVGSFGSLDISGAIDVDGVTNLDVVDIDGAVEMASTLNVDGDVTISKDSASTTLAITAHHNTDATVPTLVFKKSAGSEGSPGIVADGEALGKIEWYGYNTNGSTYDLGGYMHMKVDAAVGSSTDMPTQWLLALSPNDAAVPTTRLNMLSSGAMHFYQSDGSTSQLSLDGSGTATFGGDLIISENDPNIRMVDTNTSSYSQLTNTNGSLKIEADLGGGSGSSTLEFTVDNSTRMTIDANSRISLSNNDSGTSNTIFGKSAGLSLDAGSNYNVFIGEAVSDGAMDDAVYNVGVGTYALSVLTQGDNNVCIGGYAGYDITTSSDTILIGRNAGANISTGAAGTIAIGKDALTSPNYWTKEYS